MCGLVGVAGIITKAEQDAFLDLLIFSSVRGPHSTGVAIVDEKEHLGLFKQVGNPYELFDSKAFNKGMEVHSKRVLLGHNRFATIGDVSKANAHPFDFSDIVGMHNGTLTHSSKVKMYNYKEYDTDSQSALSNINEYDIENTVKNLDGAYAFVWFDKVTGEICFLRNEQRTLFYTFSSDRSCLFWASEAGILHAALARNRIKCTEINELTPHMYTTWEVPLEFKARFPDKYTQREELKPEEKWDYEYLNKGFYGKRWNTATAPLQKQLPLNQKKTEEEEKKEEQKKVEPTKGEVVPINPKGGKIISYKGYQGELLIPAVMEHILEEGCVFCSSSIEVTDKFRFINKSEVLCDNCMNEPEVLQMCNIDITKESVVSNKSNMN